MKRFTMTLTAGLFVILLAGCGNGPQAGTHSASLSGEIRGDDLLQFLEAHQTTSNEYATVKAAHRMFSVGRKMSNDALDVLAKDSIDDTDEQWNYRIIVLQNEGAWIGGVVAVDKKSQEIAKSEFHAKKFRL